MSRKNREFLKQKDGKVKVSAVAVLTMIAALSAVFVMLPQDNIVKAATTDFDNYIAIAIDHAQVPGALTNFPVLVYNTSCTILDGLDSNDFSFFDSDNSTECNWELEKWDDATDILIAWVNVTSISSSSDTTFYLYYDSGAAGSDGGQNNPTGAWDSNFGIVYHMNNLSDSTSNGHDLTKTDTVTATTGGKTGSYYDFAGGYLTIPNGAVTDANSSTFQIWTNRDESAPSTYYGIFHPRDDFSYMLVEYDNNTKKFATKDDTAWQGVWSQVESNAVWYHTTGISDYSSTTLALYTNGSVVDTESSYVGSWSTTETNGSILGGYQGTPADHFYNGQLDELHYSTVVRSDDWITASYNNMENATTFISWGATGEAGGTYELDITNSVSDFTWSGEAGVTIWANDTSDGTNGETGYIYTNVSSVSDNCTDIFIDISDFTSDAYDNNVSIEVINTSDGSWNGNAHQITEANGNVTLNSAMWDGANWCHGTDPFPIVGYDSTIAFRLKIEIPVGASTGEKTNSATWYVTWKVVT